MYLIGKVKRVLDGETVAWDPVALVLTRDAAEDFCPTAEFFYIKIHFGKFKPSLETVFPRRTK